MACSLKLSAISYLYAMNGPKIQLSQDELSLVQNAEWLLTKNTIIEKVFALFGNIAHEVRDRLTADPRWPEEILLASPKISKGENYKGLPYVMLDYPRLFTREHTFAIRTMFWWGHYFSTTLHIKGQYKTMYSKQLLENLPALAQQGFYVCIGDDEWRHELEEGNYIALSQLNFADVEKILLVNDFGKLSAKISLPQWNQSKDLLIELYQAILLALGH
jgi:hypothetical protein